MPAAGLAGLLSGGGVAEGTLVDRLEWVRAWTEATAAADPDPDCRALAGACRSLQVRLFVTLCKMSFRGFCEEGPVCASE